MQVAVLGGAGVGRTTFIRSLEQQPDARILSEDAIEVPVRDIANNIQLDMTFTKTHD